MDVVKQKTLDRVEEHALPWEKKYMAERIEKARTLLAELRAVRKEISIMRRRIYFRGVQRDNRRKKSDLS